ncbi:MAG TPA: flagellar hook-associated protein FlgL [Castellaniella sp.]|uniref:flagellar hook-associated protein FlgL n=1 Tax=Castellaniella sp. TaxID=1955812 RepID=UPI002F236890
MRISTSLIYGTGLNTINSQQSDLLHLYQQIGSGQKMVTPADDPLAASQAINISQSQALNARYASNRAVANQNLGTEETALSSLGNLLVSVRTSLVQAGNGTLSDADRATLADTLKSAQQTMLGLANTTDGNGQYVFSGSQGGLAAYGQVPVDPSDLTKGYTYQYGGDSLQRNIQASQTRQIAGSDVGSDVFQRAQPGTLAYTSEQTAQGAGSTAVVSQPAVTDPAANQGARYGFSVAFSKDPVSGALQYQVTTTDYVTDAGAVPPPTGTVVGPQVAWTAGQPTIDLGNGTSLSVSGDPAEGDAFTVKPMKDSSTDVNVFNTLSGLITALQQPAQGDPQSAASMRNMLNTAMQKLSTNYDNVLTVRASVGSRMNELTALDDTGTQNNLGYTKTLSGLEDLDYYDASMKLSLRQMALQGAASAFQTIQGLSLFNMNK